MEQKKYHDRGEQTQRRKRICAKLGIDPHQYDGHILTLYTDNRMSSHEIVDYIHQNTGEHITARSIQRLVRKYKESRTVAESYHNAMRRGRIQWAYKDKKIRRVKLNKGKRYEVLERDGFRCVKCGATAQDAMLEVDHIVAICNGGDSSADNLQTLCYDCNMGKRVVKKEQ